MKITFLEVAQLEAEHAVSFYETECPGLGREFAIVLNETLERIIATPQGWQPLSHDIRRCMTRRFSYAIIYRLRNGDILILAVMHLHRHPDTWKVRISAVE